MSPPNAVAMLLRAAQVLSHGRYFALLCCEKLEWMILAEGLEAVPYGNLRHNVCLLPERAHDGVCEVRLHESFMKTLEHLYS